MVNVVSNVSFVEERRPERRAGGFDRLDGTIQFYQRVSALLRPEFTLVDFGAGRGVNHIEDPVAYRKELQSFRGKVKEVIGVDVDPIVQTNPSLDRAVIITDSKLPMEDNSVDIIVSDFTFEHLPDPQGVASSFDRILKPGGWICARTPNRHGYIAAGNRIFSDKLKMEFLRGAQPIRKEEDVFPAFYRMNSRRDLEKLFPTDRFDHCNYFWDSTPSYYFNNRFVFQAFHSLHLLTPQALKTILMIFIQKKI